jgi:hypothetical protein
MVGQLLSGSRLGPRHDLDDEVRAAVGRNHNGGETSSLTRPNEGRSKWASTCLRVDGLWKFGCLRAKARTLLRQHFLSLAGAVLAILSFAARGVCAGTRYASSARFIDAWDPERGATELQHFVQYAALATPASSITARPCLPPLPSGWWSVGIGDGEGRRQQRSTAYLAAARGAVRRCG